MSEETNTENVSYLSCEINGATYILQTLPDSVDVTKDTTSNEEQNAIDILKETDFEKEEEPISLVCLGGQVYAFQNGELQELDISQIIGQTDCHEKAFLISKDMENHEYIMNENIVIENANEQPEEKYEVVTEETEKDFVIEKDNVNANDFVEVVTAFKCKICTYTTQDKMQLLGHFQKLHVNPNIDINVSLSIFKI